MDKCDEKLISISVLNDRGHFLNNFGSAKTIEFELSLLSRGNSKRSFCTIRVKSAHIFLQLSIHQYVILPFFSEFFGIINLHYTQ